jgi:hypothetical protein
VGVRASTSKSEAVLEPWSCAGASEAVPGGSLFVLLGGAIDDLVLVFSLKKSRCGITFPMTNLWKGDDSKSFG